jgi:hypothetical protein
MIKVSYNKITTLVEGYYPSNINYTNVPEPWIEIQDNEQITDKQMCVKDGKYQIYIEPLPIQLQKAKNEKIAEIKRINDEKNLEPSVAQGYLMNENNSLGELVSFEFKTTRHPSNPASDPNTILFSTLMSKINTRYSTKNAKTGEQIAIQLTPQLAQNIVSHLSLRNTTNFQYRDQLLAKIKEAKTIEEVEAISWESK